MKHNQNKWNGSPLTILIIVVDSFLLFGDRNVSDTLRSNTKILGERLSYLKDDAIVFLGFRIAS